MKEINKVIEQLEEEEEFYGSTTIDNDDDDDITEDSNENDRISAKDKDSKLSNLSEINTKG